jgi:hypothetical protein
MSDATPQKVNAKELFSRLSALETSLTLIQRLCQLPLSPEPLYVYKPQKAGGGAALKLDLRLTPTFNDKGFISEVNGGLFVELVEQTGNGEDGFARFGWQAETRLTAKLGTPDVAALLAGIRSVRHQSKPVPQSLRTKTDDKGITVGLFHKFGNDSTALEYRFGGDGSFLRVSKSKEWHRSIKLSIAEEIQLETYLQSALRAFQLVGLR